MRTLKSRLNKPLFGWVPFLIWTQVVIGSAWWSIHSAEIHGQETAAQRGRDLFTMIQLTQAWNANHVGVYAIKSDQAPPNQYLTTPNRDLQTRQGIELTMINAAYMTRQISELARSRNFHFRMTSDDPLRPSNAPDAWEKRALKSFEQGASEQIELLRGERSGEFRYMAPLKTEAECLGCHAVQGAQLGEIRGGISINIDAQPILAAQQQQITRTLIAHALIWLAITAVIYTNVRGVRRGMLRMQATQQTQARTIADKTKALQQAHSELQSLKRNDNLTGFLNREHFEKALQEALDRAEARHEAYGVAIIELDYFKEFNDAHGILEGDIVLRMAADVIRKTVPGETALFGRYIGSSFAIGIGGFDSASCRELGERIRRAIFEQGIRHDESPTAKFVTVTIGCAVCDAGDEHDTTRLLKQAALAMFKGKKGGRNRVVAA